MKFTKLLILFLLLCVSAQSVAQKAPRPERAVRPGLPGQSLATDETGKVGYRYDAVQEYIPGRAAAYQIGDFVKYNGQIYECLLQTTTAPDAAFSTPPGAAWRNTNNCVEVITYTAHGATVASLQPVFYISGSYSFTVPDGIIAAPVGLVSNVVSADVLEVYLCGEYDFTGADGTRYWEDNAVTTAPTRDTITPLFRVFNNRAQVIFDNVYDISKGIATVETDATILGDGSPLDPLRLPEYNPEIEPYVIDMGTVFDNTGTASINQAPSTFTNLSNAVDNGGGSVTFTGTAGASSNEQLTIGDTAFYLIQTDPIGRPGDNNGMTFGVSRSDDAPGRFQEDYSVYFGGSQTVQLYKAGSPVASPNIGTYDLNDVFYISIEPTRLVFGKNGVALRTINDNQEEAPVSFPDAIDLLFGQIKVYASFVHTPLDSTVSVNDGDGFVVVNRDMANCSITEVIVASKTDVGSTGSFSYSLVRLRGGVETVIYNDAYDPSARFRLKSSTIAGLNIGDVLFLRVNTLTPSPQSGLTVNLKFNN